MTDGSTYAPETRATTKREYRDYVADFTNRLRSGETITNVSGTNQGETLGVTQEEDKIEIGSGGDAPAVNTQALTTDDPEPRTIAIGKAVQYWAKATNGTPGQTYDVRVLVKTSSGRMLEKLCRHKVEA